MSRYDHDKNWKNGRNNKQWGLKVPLQDHLVLGDPWVNNSEKKEWKRECAIGNFLLKGNYDKKKVFCLSSCMGIIEKSGNLVEPIKNEVWE